MDIQPFQPNLPSGLGASQSRVNRTDSAPASLDAAPAKLSPGTGDVVRRLTSTVKAMPETREEMVDKGRRLASDPGFPNREQIAELARMIVRDPELADE